MKWTSSFHRSQARCAVALVLLCAGSVSFSAVPQKPSHYVQDNAGVIDDRIETKLNGYLAELEQKTSAQVLVLTVVQTDGVPIADFALQVAQAWQLGQKGKDNGLLMVFGMAERKYRFEVGYGLEGLLPDSRVGTIGRSVIVPSFRNREYTKGIFQGALVVANIIAKDAGVTISGMPKIKAARKKRSPFSPILSLLGLVFFVYMLIRHPRLLLFMFLFGGSGRGGWGGGGGFGGGGFGSFGGGGGGGFGGGGASGSW